MTAYPTFGYFSTKRSLGVNLYITPPKKSLVVCSKEAKLHYGCTVFYRTGMMYWIPREMRWVWGIAAPSVFAIWESSCPL